MPAILVTGASRGLGLEFTRQYAAAGWRVWACSRASTPDLDALAAAWPAVTLARLDVTRHAMIDQLAAALDGEAIDVLLNNAGVMGGSDFDAGGAAEQAFGHSDFAAWERAWRTNVVAPMKMAEAFVEHVARSGQRKIVTLSSMGGSKAPLDVAAAVAGVRRVIDGLTAKQAGRLLAWDGTILPY